MQAAARTYNRNVRRFATVLLMVLFASLNAIDGICCPDGCRHQRQTFSDSSSPQPSSGMCVLCVGGVDSAPLGRLSPGPFIVSEITRSVIVNPSDVRPAPPDHPPRF
jgi:hypothetical protein